MKPLEFSERIINNRLIRYQTECLYVFPNGMELWIRHDECRVEGKIVYVSERLADIVEIKKTRSVSGSPHTSTVE